MIPFDYIQLKPKDWLVVIVVSVRPLVSGVPLKLVSYYIPMSCNCSIKVKDGDTL